MWLFLIRLVLVSLNEKCPVFPIVNKTKREIYKIYEKYFQLDLKTRGAFPEVAQVG